MKFSEEMLDALLHRGVSPEVWALKDELRRLQSLQIPPAKDWPPGTPDGWSWVRRPAPRSLAPRDLTAHPALPRERAAADLSPGFLAALPGCAPGPACEMRDGRSRNPDPARTSRGVRSIAPDPHGTISEWRFEREDATAFLRRYPFTGSELVYCDPPYLHSTRGDLDLYACEMTEAQHIELLDLLQRLPCYVMISGYWSRLYARSLATWSTFSYTAMTRRGPATEHVWHNYPEPLELHDYRYLGKDRREREGIKLMQRRWTAKLDAMPRLKRQALLAAMRASTATEARGAVGCAPEGQHAD